MSLVIKLNKKNGFAFHFGIGHEEHKFTISEEELSNNSLNFIETLNTISLIASQLNDELAQYE